jgi:hypothetical protein
MKGRPASSETRLPTLDLPLAMKPLTIKGRRIATDVAQRSRERDVQLPRGPGL